MLDIQKNVSLAAQTTFRIGGPAAFFVAVKNEEELIEALQYATGNKIKFLVMGGGSNILFSDKGFDGLVIKMQDTTFEMLDEITMRAGAGVPLAKVVREAGERELAGLEWAAGIPGTVGGAVRGNAGAFGRSMNDSVESVRVLDLWNAESPIQEKPILRNCLLPECQFEYRNSLFKKNKNLIILSVVIKLEKGIKDEIIAKNKENIQKRVAMHPQGMGSAGSFFMNPEVEDRSLIEQFEKERGTTARGNKLPAGWIIDQAGLKGKKIGGAMVSEHHADFIVNTGNATAEDVIILEGYVKQQIRDKYGVQLQSEVEHVGF